VLHLEFLFQQLLLEQPLLDLLLTTLGAADLASRFEGAQGSQGLGWDQTIHDFDDVDRVEQAVD